MEADQEHGPTSLWTSGQEVRRSEYSFPEPQTIAGSSVEVLKSAGLGYRSNYILDLAVSMSRGELEVEEWPSSEAPTKELRKTLEEISGIGSYASANMLRLLGRTDHVYVENWMIRTFSAKRNAGNPATPADIAEYYSRFGKWKGLILWLDMLNKAGTESAEQTT